VRVPRILVGFDGSAPSRRALDHAVSRALADDEIVVVTVIPAAVRERTFAGMMPAGIELPPSMGGTFEERARARLDEIVAQNASRGVKLRGVVRLGEPAGELLALADEIQAGLIVVGHKAFEGKQLTLGHHADAIVRGARVPVTVVP